MMKPPIWVIRRHNRMLLIAAVITQRSNNPAAAGAGGGAGQKACAAGAGLAGRQLRAHLVASPCHAGPGRHADIAQGQSRRHCRELSYASSLKSKQAHRADVLITCVV